MYYVGLDIHQRSTLRKDSRLQRKTRQAGGVETSLAAAGGSAQEGGSSSVWSLLRGVLWLRLSVRRVQQGRADGEGGASGIIAFDLQEPSPRRQFRRPPGRCSMKDAVMAGSRW